METTLKYFQSLCLTDHYYGIFLGGALHWMTIKTRGSESYQSILAYDLAAENYREVPMPRVQIDNLHEWSILTYQLICQMCFMIWKSTLRVLLNRTIFPVLSRSSHKRKINSSNNKRRIKSKIISSILSSFLVTYTEIMICWIFISRLKITVVIRAFNL